MRIFVEKGDEIMFAIRNAMEENQMQAMIRV